MFNFKKFESKKYYYPHVGYPRILVKPKQKVETGELIAILERLEIEDKIVAETAGTVEDINLSLVGNLAQCNEYILTIKSPVKKKKPVVQEYTPIGAPWEASYWLTETPVSQPIIKVGDVIAKNQPVAIAMIAKQKREVLSDIEGTVAEVYFKQGQVKKQGEPLVGLK